MSSKIKELLKNKTQRNVDSILPSAFKKKKKNLYINVHIEKFWNLAALLPRVEG